MRSPLVLLLAISLTAATCGQQGASEKAKPVQPSLKLTAVAPPPELGQRAYDHVANLVAFGPRYTGSKGWQKGLDYIATTLASTTGLEPERDRWKDQTHGITFENIYLTIPGRSPHRILIACHHDTKKTVGHDNDSHNFEFVGANDSGSGVGLLLALAEVLAKQKTEATIQLAFFDGEESIPYDWDVHQALFGSKHFVAREKERELEPGYNSKLRAMVLLDMVGAVDLEIDEETLSDDELVDIFRSAAYACGHQKIFFQERMQITDDHVPFLDAGIPAIDLIDLVDNPQWHTKEDTLEHISARSLHIVGEVVLTALPALEQRFFPPPGKLDIPEDR